MMKYASSGIHHSSSYIEHATPPVSTRSPKSTSGGSLTGRPPAQVFTRGNIGSVKTHHRRPSLAGSSHSSTQQLPHAHSHLESPRRARSKTPLSPRKSSKHLSVRSFVETSSCNNGYSSEGSQASGFHSAPSTSSRRKVTSVLKELGLKAPSTSAPRERELSPSRSDGGDLKQHIRLVRKDLEGMSPMLTAVT
jgi:hypothetical protein